MGSSVFNKALYLSSLLIKRIYSLCNSFDLFLKPIVFMRNIKLKTWISYKCAADGRHAPPDDFPHKSQSVISTIVAVTIKLAIQRRARQPYTFVELLQQRTFTNHLNKKVATCHKYVDYSCLQWDYSVQIPSSKSKSREIRKRMKKKVAIKLSENT